MGRSSRKPRRREVYSINAGYLPDQPQKYNPRDYPDAEVFRDTVVTVLNDEPIDGWKFELVFRFGIYRGLNVDWAIMLNARTASPTPGAKRLRRLVERIDICHSELHTHSFTQSSDPADDQGERTTIMSLSAGDAVIVSRAYDEQMALLSREWPQRARRWIDG